MDNHSLAKSLVEKLSVAKLRITTVESCTGGALANIITDTPGSSEVFLDGFVTYSNEAKLALGVPPETIDKYTVYSVETATEMAAAGMRASCANPDIGVGITGSFSRVDPNNAHASTVGEVFVAALRGDKPLFTLKLEVPKDLDRPQAKSSILTKVLEKLLEL